jgi:hypothetical protein
VLDSFHVRADSAWPDAIYGALEEAAARKLAGTNAIHHSLDMDVRDLR